MNISSKITHESEAVPGVKFVVRRLNKIQRARRDFPLVDQNVRMAELSGELARLPNPDAESIELRAKAAAENRDLTDAELERIDAINANPDTIVGRIPRFKILHQMDLVSDQYLKPATIRAGLVSVDGYDIDGKPATAETLLESAEDALIDEVYRACEAAAALTEEQQKNSQSPSDTSVPAPAGEKSTTAASA